MLSREGHCMIKHLHELGVAQADIACRLGCSERTVRRHLALPAPPTGRPKAARVDDTWTPTL